MLVQVNFFIIVLTRLPRWLPPCPFLLSCKIAFFVDDIWLWASHRTRRTLRPFVHARIFTICFMLAEIGSPCRVSNTAVITYSSCSPYKGFPRVWLNGNLLPRVHTYRYMGATTDPPLTWRRRVTDLLPCCAQMTPSVQRIRGLRWGPSSSGFAPETYAVLCLVCSTEFTSNYFPTDSA